MSIDDVKTLIWSEKFREARECVATALQEETDDVSRWCFELQQARLNLYDSNIPVDEAIFTIDDLLGRREAPDDELQIAHAFRIHGFTLKRCQPLVELAVHEARAACSPDGTASVDGVPTRVIVAEGIAALAFDQRSRARELFDLTIAGEPDSSLPRYALADLLYVLGDFDGCHAQLDVIAADDLRWLRAARLRASCFAAVGDTDAEARQWAAITEKSEGGDFEQQDRVALALSLAGAGKRAEALEELRRAWRLKPDSDSGRFARKRIEYLERADPGTAVKRLPAFPTTAQKWNYCGPAVLELCFRYLELELDQDAIAEEVKRERGTPMYEIITFLRNNGIVARRIEATPVRLRAAVDLGLPVIVQEEYSATAHVAVITGYDESLGMFIAADPATHRPMLKSFEWTEHAGSLFGNGGVIVLGREGKELEELEEQADEAGLVEALHLSLIDECDRRRPRAGSDVPDDVALDEVIRLCDEALDIAPRFKLAWHRRFDALAHLYRFRGHPDLKAQLLSNLHDLRTTFRDNEWPHQLHGHWLFDEGKPEEAFVEYFEASIRDPDDANNFQAMGECKWLVGDLASSERDLLVALAVEPFHVRANENIAAVYLRQLQQLEADAQPKGTADIKPTMEPERLTSTVDKTEAELTRRANHFSSVARALNPGNPFNLEVAGDILARSGEWEASAEAYAAALDLSPDRSWALWGYARALEQLERNDEALVHLEKGVRKMWHLPRSWLQLSAFHERQRELEAAAVVLRRGIETLEHGREQLVSPLFEVLREQESGESAAAQLRQLAEARTGDTFLMNEVAWVLDSNQQRGHAIALLRHIVTTSPGHVQAGYRLGKLLSEDILSRESGMAHLERALEQANDAPGPREELAWLLLEDDPERALELVEPLLGLQDPYIYATRSAVLTALGRDDEARESKTLALEALGSSTAGSIELTRWHIDAQRYDRALELARSMLDHTDLQQLDDHSQNVWVAAFRLAGATREILPILKERCEDEVPLHLAFNIYWGCFTLDFELARRAALVLAEAERDPERCIEWRIHAARALAEQGDDTMLKEIVEEVGDSGVSWARLADTYRALKRYEEASAAAHRAYELDSTNIEVIGAMEDASVRRGDLEGAFSYARQLLELYPHEHHGSERLAALLAKSLDIEPALEHSRRAVEVAPYCHNAHWSRSLALFVDGQLDGALAHAQRSVALQPPVEDDPPEDCVIIQRALAGDVDGVERCLAELSLQEPDDIFADFKKRLREVAEARRDAGVESSS